MNPWTVARGILIVTALHELLHYLSARKRIERVVVSRKWLGLIGFKLKTIPTLRDILLPQVITIALLLLYVANPSKETLILGVYNTAASIQDYSVLYEYHVKKWINDRCLGTRRSPQVPAVELPHT